MKIMAMSDMHGQLPYSKGLEAVDVICICGDIVPLDIQKNFRKSTEWLKTVFKEWVNELPCDRVILTPGNHDFVFEAYIHQFKSKLLEKEYSSVIDAITGECGWADLNKLVLLIDNGYNYAGISFWGTPWCPDLWMWAFYKDTDALKEIFSLIPDNVNVLLTHSPGKMVCDTGKSLEKCGMPEFGSYALTEAVQDKHIGLWLCGHIHTGNHNLTEFGENSIKVVNVSLLNESYKMTYKPFIIEI